MRIAQRAGELEFEEALKLAQIFVKMLGRCCQHTCILRKVSTAMQIGQQKINTRDLHTASTTSETITRYNLCIY